MQRFYDLVYGTVSECIEDYLRIPACCHQFLGTQHGQMLRKCRLTEIDAFIDLANAQFTADEEAKNA